MNGDVETVEILVPGIQGPIGPPPGHVWDGTKLAFQNPNLTMAPGVDLRGLRGFSAYEVAVANGFAGTITEWLESLQAGRVIDHFEVQNGHLFIFYSDGASQDAGALPTAVVSDATFTGSPLSIAKGGTGANTAPLARTGLGLGDLATRSKISGSDWNGGDLALADGGTGASTAPAARTNLGLGNVTNTADADKPISTAQDEAFFRKAGGRFKGGVSSAVKTYGVLAGTVTQTLAFTEGNVHSLGVNGAVTLDPQGLAEGDVMQVNLVYQSGSIAVAGTTQWELGGGAKSASIADVGVALVAGAGYRIVFEMVGGVRTGVFQ